MCAADIAGLLPELHEILPAMKQLPQLDPEQARFRLFDSIAIFPFHDRNSDERSGSLRLRCLEAVDDILNLPLKMQKIMASDAFTLRRVELE